MYARAGNILLSLLGPAYFGLMHSPYVVLVVWSAACAAIFFWSNRASLRHARQVAYGTYPVPLPYMGCRLLRWTLQRFFGAVFCRQVVDVNHNVQVNNPEVCPSFYAAS